MNKKPLALLWVVLLLTQTRCVHAQNWSIHTLRTNIIGAWSRTADFDADGDPDILVQTGDSILWYENLRPGWSEHLIDAAFYHSEYALVQLVDLDTDGDIDVLKAPAVGLGTDTLSWNENQNNGANWVRHDIVRIFGNATELPHNVGDMDSDGDMDIAYVEFEFVNDPPQSSLFWLENQGSSGWVKHILKTGNHWFCTLADIDDDNDPDIIASNNNLFWLENQLPDTSWLEHEVASSAVDGNHFFGLTADFTFDGLPDILALPAPATGFAAIYASPDWQPVTIVPQSDLYYGAEGDLDHDGDQDIFYGGVGNSARKMGWAENQNNGANWVSHDITGYSPFQRLPTGQADIDGDGDNDVVVTNFNFATSLGSVFWAENPEINAGVKAAKRHAEKLTITPNPSGNYACIQLESSNTSGKWSGEIRDQAGSLIEAFEFSAQAAFPLDITRLPAGTFIVEAKSSSGQLATGQIIKH